MKTNGVYAIATGKSKNDENLFTLWDLRKDS
jgi:hypothetical protein